MKTWSARLDRPIARSYLSPDRPIRRPRPIVGSDFPPRLRLDPHLARLAPEAGAVVHRQTTLRLPLVHHLVQHGVLDLGPRMAENVAAADGDLGGPAGPEIHRQLAQPGAHPAGPPDGDG